MVIPPNFSQRLVRGEHPALLVSVDATDPTEVNTGTVDIIKQIGPLIKGGGGGQPDFATAGGKEPGGMADALKKAAELLG